MAHGQKCTNLNVMIAGSISTRGNDTFSLPRSNNDRSVALIVSTQRAMPRKCREEERSVFTLGSRVPSVYLAMC